jgi:hypothetical protein
MQQVSWWGSVILLTGLGFFVFPGHSYLQGDTQIYVPMMERIYNPVLFYDDPMIKRPHLALTAYDEIAIALRNYAGLDFENGLKLQQIVFRACAAAGLLLIALRLGLAPPGAFFVAAMVILNGISLGIGITESEPVARSFALGLVLLGVGLAAGGRFAAAGLAAAVGFLIHPTTVGPFWAVAAFVVLRRAARPILLAPFLPALGVLLLLMHFQTGGTETLDFFRRLEPFQVALQRTYMYSYVSDWDAKKILDCICECAVVAAGFWRLRERLRPPLREWLYGFAAIGVLSVPFSWIVLDQLHWAFAAPWDPTRALIFIAVLTALLSGACGVFATQERRWWEASVWFAIAIGLPMKELLATWFVDGWLIALVCALVGASIVGGWLAGRTVVFLAGARGLTLVAAGVLPFIAFPISGLVPRSKVVDTPELRQLAGWARTQTDETAVFLFADDGRYGGSGPFRARALRSIYVDYEGRALLNYYADFSAEWVRRWRDTHEGSWKIGPQDLPALADFHINYVVLRADNAIPAQPPEFSNSQYVVYRVLPLEVP